MSQELKCCPFCGGKAEMRYPFHVMGHPGQAATYRAGVRCKECGCEAVATTPPDKAIAAWNKRAQPAREAVARLLTWNGPAHMPIPHGGVCARTFEEFPKGSGESHRGYWKEGAPLYAAPPAAANQAGTWQPIETAPKDASRILIYTPGSSRKVQEVWWSIPYEGAQQGSWQTPVGPSGRGYIILESAATHWMPLPAAPHTESHAIGGGDTE